VSGCVGGPRGRDKLLSLAVVVGDVSCDLFTFGSEYPPTFQEGLRATVGWPRRCYCCRIRKCKTPNTNHRRIWDPKSLPLESNGIL
jgi:hypothetical protein